MSSRLSKDLISQYGFKSFPVKRGDNVYVLTGDFKGKSGYVNRVARRDYKVYVDSCEKFSSSGKKVPVGIDASNLRIVEFSMEEGRNKMLEKKAESRRNSMVSIKLKKEAKLKQI